MNVVLRDVEEQYTVRVRVKREVGSEAPAAAAKRSSTGVSQESAVGAGITQGTATSNPSDRTIVGPATERHPRDVYKAAGCPLSKLRPNDDIPAESRPHQGGAGTNEAPPTVLKVCMMTVASAPGA